MPHRVWRYTSRRFNVRKALGGAGSVEEPAAEAYGLKPRSYKNTSGPLATEPQILDLDDKSLHDNIVSTVQYEKIQTSYDLDRNYWFRTPHSIAHPPIPKEVSEQSNLHPSDLQVPENWDDLGFEPSFAEIAKSHIGDKPSSVQKDVIPGILNIKNRDIIYSSATGTGKTMAYVLSLLQVISNEERGVNLILVPSKQLAMQVYALALKWSEKGNIYGRNDREWLQLHLQDPNEDYEKMHEMYTALKSKWYGGPRLVIAQPSRWVDYLIHWRLTLPIRRIVVDEALTCFDPIHPTESPIRARRERNINPNPTDVIMSYYLAFPAFNTLVRAQLILLTATFTPVLENHLTRYLKTDKWVHLTTRQQFPVHIKHTFIQTSDPVETLLLKANELLPEIDRAVVFVSNTEDIDVVYQDMLESGLKVRLFDLANRENATLPTSDSSWQFLLLKEGVSYGLDIKGVTHSFISHLPSSPEAYCHMVGRCGRFSNRGKVVSLVSDHQIIEWDKMMHQLDIPLDDRLVDNNNNPSTLKLQELRQSEVKLISESEDSLKNDRLVKYTGKKDVKLYTLARQEGALWEASSPNNTIQTMLGKENSLIDRYTGPMTPAELAAVREGHKEKFLELASQHGTHNRFRAKLFPYQMEYTQQHLEHATHSYLMKWGEGMAKSALKRYKRLAARLKSPITRIHQLKEERQLRKFKHSIRLATSEEDAVHQGIPVVSRRKDPNKEVGNWATVANHSKSPIDEYLKDAELFDYDEHERLAKEKQAELAEYDKKKKLQAALDTKSNQHLEA
eukprot:TRINITY_DN12905_c0_g1_i1.p1 TRINITY_DN12905_c0_g1~~TRINITY_DN12905_c0_g1_i1.p1  ORF type:complete len:789 (+),score=91.58 TRINITY_DN12905_c0_g1_i1:88-2454(+)